LRCKFAPNAQPLAEQALPTLTQLVAERNVCCLLSAATSVGKDLLPRVAELLQCAYIGDCFDAVDVDGSCTFRRAVYAGNATAVCVAKSERVILTVRYTEFPPATDDEASTLSPVVVVEPAPPTHAATRIQRLGFDAVQTNRPPLTEARVIVSGGRALGSRFSEVLEPLADSVGAAIGASRAACDSGYAPNDFQVGQTGKIVAPDLYFAIGISGAVQHIAGIRSSRIVVAINSDPQAPIFSIADYGLVGDLFELVPELVSAIRRRRRMVDG
jgi:electron transfer flavoprotein alpha subunit